MKRRISSILWRLDIMKKSSFNLSPIVYILITFFMFTQSLWAQQEVTVGNDFGIGARPMGMGGAFIGIADDSTALHWNPAGLTQIRRLEFYSGLSYDKVEIETEYFGNTASTFTSDTHPNSIGIVLPVPVYRGGLAFGIAINRVQSFDSRIKVSGFNERSVADDPEFGELYVNEVTYEYGGIYSWNFGAAVEVARNVSLGASLNFLSGDYNYELELDADDTRNLDSVLYGFSYRDMINTEYFGIDGKIGLLARPIEQFSFGLTVDIPMDFSADEYWQQNSYYDYDDGESESEFDEGVFTYDISRPIRFGGGMTANPIPGAILAADLVYTDWTQTKYSEPPSEDISNEDFIDDYRGILQLRLGAEYTLPEVGLRLRAGYMIDPLPYNPDNREIETDRQYITMGVGFMMDEILSLDLAYVRGMWSDSKDLNTVKKDWEANRIFLSLGYRF
jgi:long-chain fatty acid transport protein